MAATRTPDRERVSAVRKARLDAGWVEVRHWAVSPEDAEQLKTYGEQLRMRSLEPNLRLCAAERQLPAEILEQAMHAIWAQGAREYVSPSGATLELLTDLCRAGDLKSVNTVYQMFALAHPGNARFVAGQVPPKVLNHHILAKLDFRGTERFLVWEKGLSAWGDDLKVALERGELDAWAEWAIRQIASVALN